MAKKAKPAMSLGHFQEKIDLHGLSLEDAGRELDYFLSTQPSGTEELLVVHGHNQGSAMMNYVRKTYKHPRIVRKLVTGNLGTTIFVLN